MSARDRLEAFLATDPRDAGCAETIRLLHVYAEVVFAGGDPDQQLPGVAVHLSQCPPCGEDLQGLLAALSDETDARRRPTGGP